MREKVDSRPRVTIDILQKDPQTEELLRNLDEKQLYHNFEKEPSKHTVRVVRAVTILSQMEGLTIAELNSLRIAALYHDIAYPEGAKDHEARSAEICSNILQRFRINEPSISEIRSIILSTKGESIDGVYVTNPKTIPQSVICDADMSLLGESSEIFVKVGNLLRQELGVDDNTSWYEGQLQFLGGLKWHTSSAGELWEERRIQHIDYINRLLEKM